MTSGTKLFLFTKIKCKRGACLYFCYLCSEVCFVLKQIIKYTFRYLTKYITFYHFIYVLDDIVFISYWSPNIFDPKLCVWIETRNDKICFMKKLFLKFWHIQDLSRMEDKWHTLDLLFILCLEQKHKLFVGITLFSKKPQ